MTMLVFCCSRLVALAIQTRTGGKGREGQVDSPYPAVVHDGPIGWVVSLAAPLVVAPTELQVSSGGAVSLCVACVPACTCCSACGRTAATFPCAPWCLLCLCVPVFDVCPCVFSVCLVCVCTLLLMVGSAV